MTLRPHPFSRYDGPSLVEALEALAPPARPTRKPLRAFVLDAQPAPRARVLVSARLVHGAVRPSIDSQRTSAGRATQRGRLVRPRRDIGNTARITSVILESRRQAVSEYRQTDARAAGYWNLTGGLTRRL